MVLENLEELNFVTVNDLEVTSIAVTQSMFGIILYWLHGKLEKEIKDVIFSIIAFNLQALKIEFDEVEVMEYINEILSENFDDLLNKDVNLVFGGKGNG